MPRPRCPVGSSLHDACTATAPCTPSRLSPRMSPPMSFLLTRQNADGFNQRLSFDVSSVTSMSLMFEVRPAREPCPQYSSGLTQPFAPPCTAARILYASLPPWKGGELGDGIALEFDNANKVAIRCAWAGNAAFEAEHGTGGSMSWASVPGECSPPPSPPPPSPSPPPSPPHLQLQCVFIEHEAEGANPCSIFRRNLTDLRAFTTRVALSAATQLANDDQTVECVAPA